VFGTHARRSSSPPHHPLRLLDVSSASSQAWSHQELEVIGMTLIASVARMHKAGIAHRDLKPDNALLRRVEVEGRPHVLLVLIDLGLAASQARQGWTPCWQSGSQGQCAVRQQLPDIQVQCLLSPSSACVAVRGSALSARSCLAVRGSVLSASWPPCC
jgi:serine/threonine protein kinase